MWKLKFSIGREPFNLLRRACVDFHFDDFDFSGYGDFIFILLLTSEARILQNGDVPVSNTNRIPILHGYSRIRIHEVSELIILIFNKYFIGYLCDTPRIHKDTSHIRIQEKYEE